VVFSGSSCCTPKESWPDHGVLIVGACGWIAWMMFGALATKVLVFWPANGFRMLKLGPNCELATAACTVCTPLKSCASMD